MATLGKLWAGRVYGTNAGNLFLQLDKTGPEVEGTFRFLDSAFGVVVYKVAGTFDGTTLRLTGDAISPPQPGVEYGRATAEAVVLPNGNLKGTWSTSIGSGGTFDAFPHDTPATDPTAPTPQPPEQIFDRTIILGAVRLFALDVSALFKAVREEFLTGKAVVTYNVGSVHATKYEKDFVNDMATLGQLDYLKVQIQEPEAHGINKMVIVELTALGGENAIRVQGIRESWVIGKAEAIAASLRPREDRVVTFVRRWGIYIIYLVMIVAIPGLPTATRRLSFVVAIALAVYLYSLFLRRVIPNASIIVSPAQPSFWARTWPMLVSFLVAIVTGAAGSYLFDWLNSQALR